MEQIFTVTTLLNALVVVVCWSVRQELKHIKTAIDEVQQLSKDAHRRIDAILAKG